MELEGFSKMAITHQKWPTKLKALTLEGFPENCPDSLKYLIWWKSKAGTNHKNGAKTFVI